MVEAQMEQGDVTLGINSGFDWDINAFNYNKYPTDYNPSSHHSQNPQYNIGADLGIALSNNMRIRFELRYTNIKSGIGLDSAEINTHTWTYNSIIVNLNYFGANARFDYKFLTTNKLEIFISPAFKFEHLMSTTMTNGPFNGMNYYGPNYIAGGAVSLLFKYNLANHVAITLTPDYSLFFREWEMNQGGKLYQRFMPTWALNLNFKLS